MGQLKAGLKMTKKIAPDCSGAIFKYGMVEMGGIEPPSTAEFMTLLRV